MGAGLAHPSTEFLTFHGSCGLSGAGSSVQDHILTSYWICQSVPWLLLAFPAGAAAQPSRSRLLWVTGQVPVLPFAISQQPQALFQDTGGILGQQLPASRFCLCELPGKRLWR